MYSPSASGEPAPITLYAHVSERKRYALVATSFDFFWPPAAPYTVTGPSFSRFDFGGGGGASSSGRLTYATSATDSASPVTSSEVCCRGGLPPIVGGRRCAV